MNKLNELKAEEARQQAEREEQRKKDHRQKEEWERKADGCLFPFLRNASVKQYGNWLIGYELQGNEPTHYYEYPFSPGNSFKIAINDFECVPLFGAMAVHIIVPTSVEVTNSRNLGHTDLYYMKDFVTSDSPWVPVYPDVERWIKARTKA